MMATHRIPGVCGVTLGPDADCGIPHYMTRGSSDIPGRAVYLRNLLALPNVADPAGLESFPAFASVFWTQDSRLIAVQSHTMVTCN